MIRLEILCGNVEGGEACCFTIKTRQTNNYIETPGERAANLSLAHLQRFGQHVERLLAASREQLLRTRVARCEFTIRCTRVW
jgi:hypothetical protein